MSNTCLVFREKEAMFKKDFLEEDGEVSSKDRREKVLKRIEEYERFEANCQKIKKLKKDQRVQLSREVINIHNNMLDSRQYTDLGSLPHTEASMEQRIQRWRLAGRMVKASSLPTILSEEDTEDMESVRSQRRSKSINSDNMFSQVNEI